MTNDFNFMKSEDTEFLLNTVTSMAITCYNLGTMSIEIDMSISYSEIIKELKNRGITIEQIEENIKTKDFTNMLTNWGSGNRERGYVMEAIEEYYNE